MGLDMYLNRFQRYKDTTPDEISVIEDYFWYAGDQRLKEKYKTAKDFLGDSRYSVLKEIPTETLDFYGAIIDQDHNTFRSDAYDFMMDRACEQVGYWRKANQIHQWFVEHVQDGEDDCCYHNEVDKETLEELLDTCLKVKEASRLVDGEVANGQHYVDGHWESIMESGRIIEDPTVAEELLPATSGFFFGSTEYDQWYMDDIDGTIEICQRVLAETDFDKQMVYYISSW